MAAREGGSVQYVRAWYVPFYGYGVVWLTIRIWAAIR